MNGKHTNMRRGAGLVSTCSVLVATSCAPWSYQVADGDCSRYRPLVEEVGAQVGWPVERMMRVIELETIGCTDFHNERSGDYGIFQINYRHAADGVWGTCENAPDRYALFNPRVNAFCAGDVFNMQGGPGWTRGEESE